jgi:hypothetical protein
LALVVKLFSVSMSAASAICSLNLLTLLEAEIRSTDDTLVTLSVFELLYEVTILSLSLSLYIYIYIYIFFFLSVVVAVYDTIRYDL